MNTEQDGGDAGTENQSHGQTEGDLINIDNEDINDTGNENSGCGTI
jgi:hypothetical protein